MMRRHETKHTHHSYFPCEDEAALHRWENEGGSPTPLRSAHEADGLPYRASMSRYLAKPNRLRNFARARRMRTNPARYAHVLNAYDEA